MRNFTRALERHKGVVFATTTKHGVGALHLRRKIPFYKLKRISQSLRLFIYSDIRHHAHLQFRNTRGELVGTLVNLNLLLLPKYSKTKAESVELAQALLEAVH